MRNLRKEIVRRHDFHASRLARRNDVTRDPEKLKPLKRLLEILKDSFTPITFAILVFVNLLSSWQLKRESTSVYKSDSKTSFEKNCFSAWASTLNMGLINKVDMVCLSPVGYGV